MSTEVITSSSPHTDDSSIGSEEQTTELRDADEAEEREDTDDTTQTPAIPGTQQPFVCFTVS